MWWLVFAVKRSLYAGGCANGSSQDARKTVFIGCHPDKL